MSTLVLTHPSCPVQEAEARAILASSQLVGTFGPFDISTSEMVPRGRLVLIDSDAIRDGIVLPFDPMRFSLGLTSSA